MKTVDKLIIQPNIDYWETCETAVLFAKRTGLFGKHVLSAEGDYKQYVKFLIESPDTVINERGQVIQAVYAATGNEYQHHYDTRGNLIKELHCLSQCTLTESEYLYEYDENDNLIRSLYPNGEFLDYKYTHDGRILSKKWSDGSSSSFEYDARDNLVKETKLDGSVIEYEYDDQNRLTAQRGDSLTSNVQFFYDEKGQCVKQVLDTNTVVTNEYDDKGRNTRSTMSSSGLPTCEVILKYDDQDNLILQSQDGQEHHWRYDERDNLVKELHPNGDAFAWEYNDRNELVKEVYPNGSVHTFSLTDDKFEVRVEGKIVATLFLKSIDNR